MRIDEVVDNAFHVQECLCPFMAAEVAHSFCAILYVAVVALDRIVVVFQTVLPARYRHAEPERAYAVKQFIECVPVVFELV